MRLTLRTDVIKSTVLLESAALRLVTRKRFR